MPAALSVQNRRPLLPARPARQAVRVQAVASEPRLEIGTRPWEPSRQVSVGSEVPEEGSSAHIAATMA